MKYVTLLLIILLLKKNAHEINKKSNILFY